MIFICDFEYEELVLHYEIVGVKQALFCYFFLACYREKSKPINERMKRRITLENKAVFILC
jgi:hypothetical protein